MGIPRLLLANPFGCVTLVLVKKPGRKLFSNSCKPSESLAAGAAKKGNKRPSQVKLRPAASRFLFLGEWTIWHFNAVLPDHQEERFKDVKERAHMTYSELARRLFDYGLQEWVLNEVIPCMSGKLGVEE